eukprot:4800600-Pyramimonas_sp.AAC.1
MLLASDQGHPLAPLGGPLGRLGPMLGASGAAAAAVRTEKRISRKCALSHRSCLMFALGGPSRRPFWT